MSHRRTFDPREARSTPPVLDRPDRACRDSDVDFYPSHPSGYRTALAVCRLCPVKAECLAWALETRQSFGVFGGTTPDERHAMIKNAGGEAA